MSKLKETNNKKQEIYDKVDKLNNIIGDLESQKNKAQKKIHRKYNEEKLVKKGIA